MLAQYWESIPKLASLSQESRVIPPAEVRQASASEDPQPMAGALPLQLSSSASPEDVSDVLAEVLTPEENSRAAAEEYALSKHQQLLTDQEGKLWDMLAESAQADHLPGSVAKFAEDLEAKSNILSESYQNRIRLPTQSTFDESKQILAAMGIPCIQPAGAFEGEALCASLVLNGYADYVASEDMVLFIPRLS